MCEPVSTVLSIGTGLMSAFGGMQQARHDRHYAHQRAEYDLAVTRNRQILADQMAQEQRNRAQERAQQAHAQARQVRQQAQVDETEQRRKNMQSMGRTRSILAANGVELDSGSALAVQEDLAEQNELDALRIRYEGQNKSRDAGFNARNRDLDVRRMDMQARGQEQQSLMAEHNAQLAKHSADKAYNRSMLQHGEAAYGHGKSLFNYATSSL